jgi:serine/threonine protein kinase
MSDQHWQRIEELFHQAAELAPIQRAEFLTRVCAGDLELRRQVESLLANDQSRDNVLEAAVRMAVDLLPAESGARGKRSLSAGTRLGPYEILAPIGAGGMGEVYRARDPRLGRDVALKILPADMAIDAVRKGRFEQEARAASALNHPNIVSVYDVGTETNTSYIVTELVDGESLRTLIQRGPVAIRKLLDLAAQLADGLGAAHAAGIVHRDLKPENVMLTRDGRVKILDFGLAKPVARPVGPSDATRDMGLTEPGMILGTLYYLSPEQARGSNELDGQSDQFSFGLMLHELLTGKKPFDRPSAAETMAAIIREEPPPLPSTIPPPLRWTIERCLAKEPSERYDTTRDLYLELSHLRNHAGEIATGPNFVTGADEGRVARRWRRMWVWTLLNLLIVAAGIYCGLLLSKRSPPSFERLTFRRGSVSGARFSTDGQTLVFSAQWATEPSNIYTMQAGGRESRSLDLPPARVLSISSSGQMAILLNSDSAGVPGTLARVPLSGGAPREILENVTDADWSPDGNNLAVSYSVQGRNRIEYPMGTILYENQGRPPDALRISPKGDLIAFFEFDNAVGDFAVTVLDTHGGKRILSRGWRVEGGLAWSPKGDEIWFGGGETDSQPNLRAVKVNGNSRVVSQAPVAFAIQDVTRSGRVLVTAEDSRIGISALVPAATQERDLSWFDASRIYDISEDGKQVLFIELSYGKPRNPAIYLRKTDGSPAVRLGDGNRPALSPDGKWVACIVSDGTQTSFTLLPTGAGVQRTIGGSGLHYERVEWFPDGQRVLLEGSEPNRPARTFVQDLEGGKPVPLTPEGTQAARVSPDQKYATIIRAGKLSLFPIQGTETKVIANVDPGESVIRWSGDGRFLFLRKFDEPASLEIDRIDVATGRKALWKKLRTPDPVGVHIGPIVLTPDGLSYAYSFQRDISTLYLADGLK